MNNVRSSREVGYWGCSEMNWWVHSQFCFHFILQLDLLKISLRFKVHTIEYIDPKCTMGFGMFILT